ncbi:hypothetical protein KC343_g1532 [Hortaea werneckii]|uniref:Protein LOT5 n=1 Tax=Hortaea werneckii TaxID=91943 RepID=A0A3M7G5I5_HORWE|nr:hypothetical protein KC352_g13903 [Hortaea werneckii]KAI7571279.1 hypothetical protein KC317_g1757 [Hortaea werneckii]KAI7624504.1 hypothetical protein KC346_g2188 [Hortaea werneckii]KAI7635963.1 hypothetical protein KC343_g1532 [Hortaea werneckii]KAI7681293.1 hypothetical protein KC319_g1664 [Hortaea werneckii]
MADTYETVTQKPQVEDFTPLDQHQEQTPQSFFAAKPVLHLQSPRATVAISKEDAEKNADFGHLASREEEAESISFKDIDVWVTSRYLVLWSPAAEKGLRIPYPTITIHAQEGQAVLLELNLSDSNTADEDLEFIQLRISPTSTSGGSEAAADAGVNGHANGNSDATPVKVLYDAISACQELNPDPNPEGDDEEEGGVGGFDETAPGATGWITSENMADFMDEDGNFRMPEGATVIGGEEDGDGEGADGLGAGAGRRRAANEVDAEDGAAQDETKWQRTG